MPVRYPNTTHVLPQVTAVSLHTYHWVGMLLRGILLALFLLVTDAQAQPSSSEQLREVTVQLKWHHQFQFAGYYAALEREDAQ